MWCKPLASASQLPEDRPKPPTARPDIISPTATSDDQDMLDLLSMSKLVLDHHAIVMHSADATTDALLYVDGYRLRSLPGFGITACFYVVHLLPSTRFPLPPVLISSPVDARLIWSAKLEQYGTVFVKQSGLNTCFEGNDWLTSCNSRFGGKTICWSERESWWSPSFQASSTERWCIQCTLMLK